MFRLSSQSHIQAVTWTIFWYTIYSVFKYEISFKYIILNMLGYKI